MTERVWFDIDQVPSGGITYPKDWKISITPYSFGDVLNLARAVETGVGALDKILSGVKCSFDKDLLLPADIIYLGIYRKLVSTKHTKIEFSTVEELENHIKWMQEESVINLNVLVNINDQLMTLQTCYYEPSDSFLLINLKKVEDNNE